MSKFLKIDDLIKKLQEIKEMHGNLAILLANTHEQKWELAVNFDIEIGVGKNIEERGGNKFLKAVTIGGIN